jgi:rubrerythrin
MALQMTGKQKELFKIFKMAITAEQDAQKMYQQAAECCDDDDMKRLLQSFVHEESGHENQLVEMYNKMKAQFGMQ